VDIVSERPRTMAAPLARGLQILSCVAVLESGRVEDLAAQTKLPLSTVYRYVRQLRENRYLNEVNGTYVLGPRFAARYGLAEDGHLIQLAGPVLRLLRDRTGGAAMLTVRVRTAGLCLDRLPAVGADRRTAHRGGVLPLYPDASTLPLLTNAPAEVIEEVLAEAPAVARELAFLNRFGFAVSHGDGTVTVGSPVLRDAECVCAVSASGPESALVPMIGAVRDAGAWLSRTLKGLGSAAAWESG
jgi:DNA-binding IclR family transcriptional regulator